MTSRIRILGIFLVIGGLLFVGAGAFTFVKQQEGAASLKAFSEKQNVRRSYDEQGQEAVFENPAKDWPTRITYQRAAADRLVITLSDPHGTSDKVERFDLQRSQG